MVSALSSRLFGQLPPTKPESQTGDHNGARKPNADSLSGYSADLETVQLPIRPPPILIDLHLKQKREHVHDEEEGAKRRRLEEANFVAANVKEALSKAGKPMPSISTRQSRVIPGLDLSCVTLINSKSVESSPFLHRSTVGWESGKYDILTDFGLAYQQLVSSTAASYRPTPSSQRRPKRQLEDDCDINSTSSVSDTESDGGSNCSSTVVVKARLDNCAKDQDLRKSTNVAAFSHLISSPPLISMSIEEAVGVCYSSRLVASSAPPYKVVFANAAYGALTGLGSGEALGRCIGDLVALGKPGGISLEACSAASSEGNDTISYAVTRHDGSNPTTIQCTMKVTPVVSGMNRSSGTCDSIGDIREINNITHFAIDLIDLSCDQTDEPLALMVMG